MAAMCWLLHNLHFIMPPMGWGWTCWGNYMMPQQYSYIPNSKKENYSIHFITHRILFSTEWHVICSQQVPEDIERVMVGIEAYLSIRKHTSDSGLSFFENDDEIERDLNNKVGFCLLILNYKLFVCSLSNVNVIILLNVAFIWFGSCCIT